MSGGGAAAAGEPPRLYWVPAVGVLPAIEHYRLAAGLAEVPQAPTADMVSVSLAGAGEAMAPGQARGQAMAAQVVAALGGVDLSAGG
jgi:hypothetical protein